MILRRLSQSLQEQNWTAICIEFVLLVTGVFLGIQVANWNEQRQFRAQERELLGRLRIEIRQNIASAQEKLEGIGRRFNLKGELDFGRGKALLVDDYGHHPRELEAVFAAARGGWPERRLVVAFQPHRYSRTRDCFEDFVKVIGQADAVLLAEVYAAGEAPIVAADGRSLARALRVAGKVEPVFVDAIADMPQAVLSNAQDGDVVICMGAGSIGAVPAKVVELGGAA